LIDAMIEIFDAAPVRQPRIALPAQGGAIKRVARDATALWHRDALVSVVFQASGDDGSGDIANTQWVRSNWPRIESFTSGVYANTNFADSGADRVRAAYGGNYDRLVALKSKFDPDNLFRLNANIQPRA